MRHRLRSYEGGIPGGYFFKQAGPDGRMQDFPQCPMIEHLAMQVMNWRKGNGMARATKEESLQDVDSYQCQRLGNNPTYCVAANRADVIALAANNPYIAPQGGCASCGAPVPTDTRT